MLNGHHEGIILTEEPVYGFWDTLRNNIRGSAQRRIWQWRILILLYCFPTK